MTPSRHPRPLRRQADRARRRASRRAAAAPSRCAVSWPGSPYEQKLQVTLPAAWAGKPRARPPLGATPDRRVVGSLRRRRRDAPSPGATHHRGGAALQPDEQVHELRGGRPASAYQPAGRDSRRALGVARGRPEERGAPTGLRARLAVERSDHARRPRGAHSRTRGSLRHSALPDRRGETVRPR